MATVAVQPGIGELLEQAGARPRGNRHDCPKCGGLRTVTHAEECFYCHKCQWKGNAVSLAKELGIYRRIPKAEYIRQRRERAQARSAATGFLETCRIERLRTFNELRQLARLETLAHDAGADSPVTWDALALVYSQRPSLTATAVLLSEGSIPARRRWLEADSQERGRIAEEILLAGGFSGDAGKFVQVNL
ncbi:MAG TPA: hypothetical protein VKV79_06835 [Terriglobia bacterium]|nr:hypothetical protein [Terriglobia bacterium]